MIYDTLNNLPNYLGMSDNLDAVIEFVMARDINNLPAGKTRIDGDKAVAYRLSSGEGFYEQLYTVQPGSIVEVGGDAAAQDDAPADNVNSVEGI